MQKELNEWNDDVKAKGGTADNRTQQRMDTLKATILQMDTANEDMMTWMANYKSPEKLPAAEALSYLQQQYQLIDQNNKDISSALQKGRQFWMPTFRACWALAFWCWSLASISILNTVPD
ncbi:MAG: hypothetical protein IPL65_03365 [Lewinellaceae bacterium]|nr:hypothetical protein [Lewinellaceae bacterium]